MSRHASTAQPLPSRAEAVWFWLRVRGLTLRRLWLDAWRREPRRWPRQPAEGSALAGAPVLAELSTPLWTDGRAEEFVLIAGKVHNLRLARLAFDGLEVPAHALMGFWTQLGRATRLKGYVAGREVREGCVVPTIAGGLCQLSNALATVAQRAGMALVERHGHTARIEGVAAAPGMLDATVLWKHVDLRLRAPFAWRLEVAMDAAQLHVRVRAHGLLPGQAAQRPMIPIAPVAPPVRAADQAPSRIVARGCITCNETACFRHAPQLARQAQARPATVACLDGLTPEAAAALRAHGPPLAWVLPSAVTAGQRLRVARGLLPADAAVRPNAWGERLWALRRALHLRRHAHTPGRRQAALLQGQDGQARVLARTLRPGDTEVWVDQAFLPAWWQGGVLAGRRFSVWMPVLPMAEVVRRLDLAAQAWPQEASLRDFRPDADAVQAELDALRAAACVLTAHQAVADWARAHLRAEVRLLPWHMPPGVARAATPGGDLLVLLGSALARKGWCELRAALGQLRGEGLRLPLGVLGSLPGDAGADLAIEALAPARAWPRTRVAVLPAHVEHAPRLALQALARGLPVIATPACGLPPQPGLALVPEGDVRALADALRAAWSSSEAGGPPM